MNNTKWKRSTSGGYSGIEDIDQRVWCLCGEEFWIQGMPYGETGNEKRCPKCGKNYRLVYAVRLEELDMQQGEG